CFRDLRSLILSSSSKKKLWSTTIWSMLESFLRSSSKDIFSSSDISPFLYLSMVSKSKFSSIFSLYFYNVQKIFFSISLSIYTSVSLHYLHWYTQKEQLFQASIFFQYKRLPANFYKAHPISS